MSLSIEYLKKLEKNHNLFLRQFNGWNYWQMIRYDISQGSFADDSALYDIQSDEKKKILTSVYFIKHFIPDILKLIFGKKYDVLYFDQGSYRTVDGEIRDPYFDYYNIEKVYKVFRCFYTKRNPLGKTGIGTSPATFIHVIYKIFIKWWVIKFNKDEIIFINKLESELRKHGWENKGSLRDYVVNAYLIYKSYSCFYKFLLKKYSPKATVIICHYDVVLFPLFKECKKQDIPVIELQHGSVIGTVAYSYFDISNKGKYLPDFYFSYGKFWERYISFPESVKICTIGNAFLSDRREKYKKNKPDDKKIAFFSQPFGRSQLINIALELSRILQDYKIFFKLHPSEYDHIEEINVRFKEHKNIVIVDTQSEIYSLLSEARHHVGISSTALYEGVIFDTKRYILWTEEQYKSIKNIVDIGLASFFQDAYELADQIVRGYSEDISIEKLTDQMWKSDVSVNMRRALKEII